MTLPFQVGDRVRLVNPTFRGKEQVYFNDGDEGIVISIHEYPVGNGTSAPGSWPSQSVIGHSVTKHHYWVDDESIQPLIPPVTDEDIDQAIASILKGAS